MTRFIFLLVIVISLSILVPPAIPAGADYSNKPRAQTAALIIKAPDMIKIDQAVNITVFSKYGHDTIAGASVFAVRTDNISVAADGTNYITMLKKFAVLAETNGIFVGNTGSDGTLNVKLSQTGHFMLVSTKDGFLPGFTRLTVALTARKGLNIKIPGTVETGKPVTITVFERHTHQPVAKVAIYGKIINALSLAHPPTIQPQIKTVPPQAGSSISISDSAVIPATSISANITGRVVPKGAASPLPLANAVIIKANPANIAAAEEYAAEMRSTGILLGYTDDSGQLLYTFANSGIYVLTAIRDEFIPGLARISVKGERQGRLGVKAPATASIGQDIRIKVFERNSGKPTGGAAVYCFKPKIMQPPTIQQSPAPTENGTAIQILIDSSSRAEIDAIEAQSLMAQSAFPPLLIGYTDSNGEIEYSFSEAGFYALVATCDGYLPGGARINITAIKPLNNLKVLPVPKSTNSAKQHR